MNAKASFLVLRHSPHRVSVSFNNCHKLTALGLTIVREYLKNIITTRGTQLEINLRCVKLIDSGGFDTLNIVSRIGRNYDSTLILINVEIELLEMIELIKKYHIFDVDHIKSAC